MQIEQAASLAAHTSFEIGGLTRLWRVTATEATTLAESLERRFVILGSGTNVLANDGDHEEVVLTLIKETSGMLRVNGELPDKHRIVSVHGAELWDQVASFCAVRKLQGIECLSGIPGTAGAAVVQNIGAYGQQISDVVERVLAVDLHSGFSMSFSRADCGFGYRRSIFNRRENLDRYLITAIHLRLCEGGQPCCTHPEVVHRVIRPDDIENIRKVILDIRATKGMLEGQYCSAGSFFKNPLVDEAVFREQFGEPYHVSWWREEAEGIRVSAGWLIEHAGFGRRYSQGPVGLSPHHALCIINRGGARAADVVSLAKRIQERVRDHFGILLEPEVRLIGFPTYPLLTA